MKKSLSCLLAAMVLSKASLPAQDQVAVNRHFQFEKQTTTTVKLGYLLSVPKEYNNQTEKRWPLILFLHGAGERGANLSQVAVHGPPKLVNEKRDLPFIIVSPQCPPDGRWENEAVLGLLDEVMAKYRVDARRVYLTGLSMGGFGSWSLASRYPERFAAVAPICGGGEIIDVLLASRQKSDAIKTLGVWAFHGAKDPVVPLSESERMVGAFKKAGCPDVEFTVYPEAQHDSWTETYNNPKLFEWFLKHERK